VTRELTPLGHAKQLGLPFVKIVIDRRHVKGGGGKIEVEGPATEKQADAARDVMMDILTSEEKP